MCSIYGFITSRDINDDIFRKCLRHRGPDGDGTFRDEAHGLVLGHGRLSIIDLSSSADQPMIDSSGQFVIVFNGEIYNYQEIREGLKKKA